MGSGPDSTTEVLAGLVERVTFYSEESGFCVLRVKDPRSIARSMRCRNPTASPRARLVSATNLAPKPASTNVLNLPLSAVAIAAIDA